MGCRLSLPRHSTLPCLVKVRLFASIGKQNHPDLGSEKGRTAKKGRTRKTGYGEILYERGCYSIQGITLSYSLQPTAYIL